MITEGLRLESAQNPYRSEITQGYSHHRFLEYVLISHTKN
jgi:hypothetical protein